MFFLCHRKSSFHQPDFRWTEWDEFFGPTGSIHGFEDLRCPFVKENPKILKSPSL